MRLSKYYLQIALFGILLCLQACDNKGEEAHEENKPETVAVETTPVIPYQVVNEFPHDPAAFTEGLQFVDGILYESTGEYGTSDIRKVDPKTGKVLKKQPLEEKYFGEGMTVLNGKVYQLTYREKTGFVYDAATLKLLQTFSFNTTEGWGMTNDGTNLIYGDGSSMLYFLDPATFKEVKQVEVKDPYGPVANINELEYINGHIYANQWQTDNILKIDPKTGKVVARADLRTLRERTGIPQLSGEEKAPEVLNGIAYDAETNRIFITGKFWPKIFEIKLDN